jgi:UDP-2-acetamido-2,6-beta-L-arabino-hexul-4-ose reductase
VKKRVALTGASGFLGSYIKSSIDLNKSYEYIKLNRNFEADLSTLKNGDILIHAASVHRDPDPENVYFQNIKIIKTIVETLKNNDLFVNIIFISSIHEVLDTPYGKSKKDGGMILEEYCNSNKTLFVSHRLPNLFGPNAKPNSTSFIATFCYNIHNNIPCNYNDNIIKICYVEDVVKLIVTLGWRSLEFKTKAISVRDVYLILKSFKYKIDNGIKIEPLNNFENNLLITFLSYKNYKIS